MEQEQGKSVPGVRYRRGEKKVYGVINLYSLAITAKTVTVT